MSGNNFRLKNEISDRGFFYVAWIDLSDINKNYQCPPDMALNICSANVIKLLLSFKKSMYALFVFWQTLSVR